MSIKSGGVGLYKRNNVKNFASTQNLKPFTLLDNIRGRPLNTMGDGGVKISQVIIDAPNVLNFAGSSEI